MGDDMLKTEAQVGRESEAQVGRGSEAQVGPQRPRVVNLLLMRLYPDLNQLSAGERVQQRVKRMGGDVRQLVEQLWAEVEDMERARMQARAARAAGTGGGSSPEASSEVASTGTAGSKAGSSAVTSDVSSSGAGTVTRPEKPKRRAPPLVAPPSHPARAAAQSLPTSPGASSQTDKSARPAARPAAVPVVIRAVRPSQMYGEGGVKGVGEKTEEGEKERENKKDKEKKGEKEEEREEVLPALQRPAGFRRFDSAAEAKGEDDKGVKREETKEEREEVLPALQRPAGSGRFVSAVEASGESDKGVKVKDKEEEREEVLPALQRPAGSGRFVSAAEASKVSDDKGAKAGEMTGGGRAKKGKEEQEEVLPALQRPAGSGRAVSSVEASTVADKGVEGERKQKGKEEREEVMPVLQRPAGAVRAVEASTVVDKSVEGERKKEEEEKDDEQREEALPALQRPAGAVRAVEASTVADKGVEREGKKKGEGKGESEEALPALQRPLGSGGTVSAAEASAVVGKGVEGERRKKEEREALQRPLKGIRLWGLNTSPEDEKAIQKAVSERTTVTAKVVACNHGGLVLSLNGVQAFLPASSMLPELRRWSFRGWLRANRHDPNLFGAREERDGGDEGGRKQEEGKARNKGKDEKQGKGKEVGGGGGKFEVERREGGEEGEGGEGEGGGEGVETLRVQLSEQYSQEKLALFSSYVGEEVRVRVEKCDSKTHSVFVTQRGADLEDKERAERREQLQHRLEAGDVVTSTVVYIGDMNMTVQVEGVNVMIHYDTIRQLKQGPVDTWPFPIGHSLPVRVLRSKPVQKRLVVSLEPPQGQHQQKQRELRRQQQQQGRQQQGRQQWKRQPPVAPPLDLLQSLEAADSAPSMQPRFEAAAELEAVAANLRATPGITSVNLGRVAKGGALAPGFQIFLASQSASEYKLVARAGLTIQELLVVSDLDKEAIRGAIQQAIGQLIQRSASATMRRADVLACQIQSWYPAFRSVSLRTEIVPLPPEFVDYLLSDGIFLPASCKALPTRMRVGEWEAHCDDYEGMKEEDDEADEPDVPSFPALEAAVDAAIARLGGAVLPKLNWSCPKDVGWLSATGTPKCSNAQEVFLLLKASDSLTYDLCHAFDSCVDSSSTADSSKAEAPLAADDSEPASSRSDGGACMAATGTDEKQKEPGRDEMNGDAESRQEKQDEELEQQKCAQQSRPPEFVLALSKWFDLRPEMEFRCFVKGHQLIGISQREITSFYPFLVDSHDNFKLQICDFYNNHICGKFPSTDYTFDVYITRDGRVKLVDFNTGVQLGLRAASGAPFDLHDRSEGSAFEELMEKLKVECTTDQDSSSDEEEAG
ncbi:unnamed protein product [Closterium sp. Yama58-4]|nr:unnamed protein product [Closterium sp. Yama58-4]